MIPLFLFLACDMFSSAPDVSGVLQDAEQKLTMGDFPAAQSIFEKALEQDPNNHDALTGVAYLSMIGGDYGSADEHLAKAQRAVDSSSEEGKEITSDLFLRRGMVAIRDGAFTKALQYCVQSELPAGYLFAAEISIIEGEYEDALEYLSKVQSSDSKMRRIVAEYTDRLEDSSDWGALLAESQASWALGDYKVAVRTVKKPLLDWLEQEKPKQHDRILLWAGRAASVGEIGVGNELLDSVSKIRQSQVWRVEATKAILSCASSEADQRNTCLEQFSQISKAPIKGIRDAKVTAARLVFEKEPSLASQLLDGIESNAAAAVWNRLGDLDEAQDISSGLFLKSLE